MVAATCVRCCHHQQLLLLLREGGRPARSVNTSGTSPALTRPGRSRCRSDAQHAESTTHGRCSGSVLLARVVATWASHQVCSTLTAPLLFCCAEGEGEPRWLNKLNDRESKVEEATREVKEEVAMLLPRYLAEAEALNTASNAGGNEVRLSSSLSSWTEPMVTHTLTRPCAAVGCLSDSVPGRLARAHP